MFVSVCLCVIDVRPVLSASPFARNEILKQVIYILCKISFACNSLLRAGHAPCARAATAVLAKLSSLDEHYLSNKTIGL